MYTNNNRMARRSARNTKENCFGLQNVNQKYGMIDESFAEQRDADRYSMNYFYDIDQSCVDQLKEFLHQKSGNEYTWTDPKQFTRLSVTRGFRLRHHDDLHVSNSSQRKWSMFYFYQALNLLRNIIIYLTIDVCQKRLSHPGAIKRRSGWKTLKCNDYGLSQIFMALNVINFFVYLIMLSTLIFIVPVLFGSFVNDLQSIT